MLIIVLVTYNYVHFYKLGCANFEHRSLLPKFMFAFRARFSAGNPAAPLRLIMIRNFIVPPKRPDLGVTQP